MGIRGAVFLSLFALALIAAPFNPVWGILAYLGHYYLLPENQWWGDVLARLGMRVSLTIAIVAIISTLIHWSTLKQRFADRVVHPQEILYWLYVAIVGLSVVWGLPPNPELQPAVLSVSKMPKIGIFLFLLTHVITTRHDLLRVLWFMLTVGGAYLAWVGYQAPPSAFTEGRLEGIGGPDFQDSNFLATHFAAMGILAGTQLVANRNVLQKVMWLASGALIANAVILTRSRGAFLGIAAAAGAVVFLADYRIRKHLFWLLPVVAVGGYALTDANFWERIATLAAEERQEDSSFQGRLMLWSASLEMFADHPLGIGADNFFAVVGSYNPEMHGRDTHSTYLRCLAELGILGVAVLIALQVNALLILHRCRKRLALVEDNPDLQYAALGMQLAVIVFAVSGLAITMTYNEEFFILLLLPVCFERAVNNLDSEPRYLLLSVDLSDEAPPDGGATEYETKPLTL